MYGIYICIYVIYIYIMEYYSAMRRMNNTICRNMDKPRDYHTK